MSTTEMLWAEIRHRLGNFGLSLIAVMAAIVLLIVGPTLLASYQSSARDELTGLDQSLDERLKSLNAQTQAEVAAVQNASDEKVAQMYAKLKRATVEMGFNIRIVAEKTDDAKLLANFEAAYMPETYIKQLAQSDKITKIAHIIAKITKPIEQQGQPRLIIGIAAEEAQYAVGKKKPLVIPPRPGHVYLGHLVTDKKQGDKFNVLDEEFTIQAVMEPKGSAETDIAIVMNLADAQRVLDCEGQITEIQGVNCECESTERLSEIREQVEQVLPEAKVIEIYNIAEGRQRSRALAVDLKRELIQMHQEQGQRMVEDEKEAHAVLVAETRRRQAGMTSAIETLVLIVTPVVLIAAAIWVGLLAWFNVQERRTEIGLLRAMGRESGDIASLIMGRAALLGLTGSLLGIALGLGLAYALATGPLAIDSALFAMDWKLLLAAALGGPLLSAMAAYIPTLLAIGQDPAAVLMEA